MAGSKKTYLIYDKTGQTYIKRNSLNDGTTISDIISELSNYGITAISNTVGGEALLGTDLAINYVVGTEAKFYDVTPQAETVTGFYLDGTEYKFGGGGSGGIQNDTTGTTSTVTKIRAGTEAEYNALSSKDATTIYHVF